MARRGGKRRYSTRQIALGGIFSALALVVMLGGGILPIGIYAAPIFASICLLPLFIELGSRVTLLAYATVGLLSFFLVPDKEPVLFFIGLTGYYPVLQPVINRLRHKALRVVCKLVLFNLVVAAVYALLLFVFSPAFQAELGENAWWFWAALLAVGNLTFLLYDVLLDKGRVIYLYRIRKMLFRNR